MLFCPLHVASFVGRVQYSKYLYARLDDKTEQDTKIIYKITLKPDDVKRSLKVNPRTGSNESKKPVWVCQDQSVKHK